MAVVVGDQPHGRCDRNDDNRLLVYDRQFMLNPIMSAVLAYQMVDLDSADIIADLDSEVLIFF